MTLDKPDLMITDLIRYCGGWTREPQTERKSWSLSTQNMKSKGCIKILQRRENAETKVTKSLPFPHGLSLKRRQRGDELSAEVRAHVYSYNLTTDISFYMHEVLAVDTEVINLAMCYS